MKRRDKEDLQDQLQKLAEDVTFCKQILTLLDELFLCTTCGGSGSILKQVEDFESEEFECEDCKGLGYRR